MSLKLEIYKLLLRTTVRRGFSSGGDAAAIQNFFATLDTYTSRWPRRSSNIKEVRIGRITSHWLEPKSGFGEGVILYLHGGAFIARTPRSHASLLSKLCNQTGMRGLMPDYGLLPQDPFPAAQEDCEAAYKYLMDQGVAPDKIVLAGDSAGGFLCMTTLHRLREAGLPSPKAVVLISPGGVIHREERLSARTNDRLDVMFSAGTIERLFAMVMPDQASGPDYYPLETELGGLPPIHIEVGEPEVLLDDSRILAERVTAAGGDVSLTVIPGAPHVLPVFPVREAAESIDRIVKFIHNAVGTDQA